MIHVSTTKPATEMAMLKSMRKRIADKLHATSVVSAGQFVIFKNDTTVLGVAVGKDVSDEISPEPQPVEVIRKFFSRKRNWQFTEESLITIDGRQVTVKELLEEQDNDRK